MDKNQAIEFLKEFIKNYKHQDKINVEYPRFYVLQCKVDIPVANGYQTKFKTIDNKEVAILEHWQDREIFFTLEGYNRHVGKNEYLYKHYQPDELRLQMRHATKSFEIYYLLKSIAKLVGEEID